MKSDEVQLPPNYWADQIRADLARRAADRLRRAVAEHASEPDCGDDRCLLHWDERADLARRRETDTREMTEETADE